MAAVAIRVWHAQSVMSGGDCSGLVSLDMSDGLGEEVGVTYGEGVPPAVTNLVVPKNPP